MDTKITKKRLNDHFSYDWIKYVALILATVLLFWFLYDVGATRPTLAQNLEIYILNGTANSDNQDNFQERLRDSVRGSKVSDSRGRAVYHRDEVLTTSISSYESYSTDSNVQQAVSVKLMGGQESDLMVLDYNTFLNFMQTWLLSMEEYKKDVEAKLAEAEAPGGLVDTYPDQLPADLSDVDAIKRFKERELWISIREEYDRFFVEKQKYSVKNEETGEKEIKEMTRLERYGYRQNRLKSDHVGEWNTLSQEFDAKIKTLNLDEKKPEDVKTYQEESAKFTEKYEALLAEHGEGDKYWGLDISKFDMAKVKNGWFNTGNSMFKRNFGDLDEAGNPIEKYFFFSLGITVFKDKNGTSYFELVKVFNFFIDQFAGNNDVVENEAV